MGNTNESSIADILGDPITDKLKNLEAPCKEICKDCQKLEECYGCAAHAVSLNDNCSYLDYYNEEMKEYVDRRKD